MRHTIATFVALLLIFLGQMSSLAVGAPPSPGRGELVIADFEGADYGDWKTTGNAFGSKPAPGALPGQMDVGGFQGKGLVNSFLPNDDATGTLTSPPFRIERDHLSFLIGGGGFAGETCLNLVIDGKVARTATGPNLDPGGTERLRWKSWDVRDLAGQTATLAIVDARKGSWGHINVDRIVQGDEPHQARPASREIVVDRRYLHLPVRTGAPMLRVKLIDAGQPVGAPGAILREFKIELVEKDPEFQVFLDMDAFKGRTVRMVADEVDDGSKPFAGISQADEVVDSKNLYTEARRPQFHFTSRRGWLNDPNGLVWYEGEYHLFYQHNPYGRNWENMHWGHAVSKDLIHWTELPIALYPPKFGDMAFSGSGFIDPKNTAGFVADGENPALVVAFTSTARGECIAFSTDRGRTFREPAGNPVVKHAREGRDPKVFWHEPSKRWVMAVYDEPTHGRPMIAFHTSTDLKTWTPQAIVDGFFECPDIFELPVDDDSSHRLWVMHAADGQYLVGNFDGRRFSVVPGASTRKHRLWFGNFYAAQSYSNTPDGRRIQIGWGNGITFPGMPFNQQMTVPCRLTLRTIAPGPDGREEIRLFAEPVKELESLRNAGSKKSWSDLTLAADANPLKDLSGDLFEILATIEVKPGQTAPVEFNLRGTPLTYDPAAGEIRCEKVKAPLAAPDGLVKLRILLDRGSIEVFGNDGRVAISLGIAPDAANRSLGVKSVGGPAQLKSLEVFELQSAWREEARRELLQLRKGGQAHGVPRASPRFRSTCLELRGADRIPRSRRIPARRARQETDNHSIT